MNTAQPTPYAELNEVLGDFVAGLQTVLGDTFVGAYLQGSFAVGDFDEHSDVDFTVAIAKALQANEVAALQALHRRVYALPSPWATHLEGSYFPLATLRRFDPASEPLWYLDNGSNTLEPSKHDDEIVMRWVMRERGIVLAGPPPHTLIDPIQRGDFEQEIRATMRTWGADLFAQPEQMDNGWRQPFVVLSYCRMLHSLHTGSIESKLAGAEWAKTALDQRWMGLIERAWLARPDPSTKVRQGAAPADIQPTFEFITYAIEWGKTGNADDGHRNKRDGERR